MTTIIDQIWLVIGVTIIILLMITFLIISYVKSRTSSVLFERTEEHETFVSHNERLPSRIFGIYNVQVSSSEKWLLFRDGLLYKQLGPGPHRWWSIFSQWEVMHVNMHVQLLSFTTQGRMKGAPNQLTSEQTVYNVEIELGIACKIVDLETYLSHRNPVSMLLAHVKDMVFDLITDISYDQYGQWARTLRDLVKTKLQGDGVYSAERLFGLRTETVYLRSFNASILHDYSMQSKNRASNMRLTSTTIFISYAHEDEKWRKELEKQLSNLQNQGLILNWYDRQISAGTEWEREIKEHLETAQVILLLISPDFMASQFCYSIELEQAIQRHNRGDAHVIPIILRSVDWKNASFARLQVLPTDAKPVLSAHWHNIDEALLNVAEGIRKVVEKLQAPS